MILEKYNLLINSIFFIKPPYYNYLSDFKTAKKAS